MAEEYPQKTIHEIIQKKIQQGEIKMKPRWIFVFRSLLIIGTAILSFLLAIFLTSFIHFILFASGAWFLPSFGARGFQFFFFAFPWPVLFFVIFFLIILGFLAKQFSFAYHRPAIYSILGILILATIGGALIRIAPFHDRLLKSADDQNLPLMGLLYGAYERIPLNNALVGEVSSTTASGFLIEDKKKDEYTVFISPKTIFPSGSDIKLDDTVLIVGEHIDKNIDALGVKKINQNESPSLFQHRLHLRLKMPLPFPPDQNKERNAENPILPNN